MAASITILGVRHHGPGSARMVAAALERLQPDAIVVELPADAEPALAFGGNAELVPPVAILLYLEEDPSSAIYLPYAEFSPEWQTLRYATARGIPLICMDLPLALQTPAEEEEPAVADASARLDPLEELARAAGYEDGEMWWERLIEERIGEEDVLGAFDAVRGAMAEVRGDCGVDEEECLLREAHMRKSIRAVQREGRERIAVVCGAYHAPAIDQAALKRFAVGADNDRLKGRKRRTTVATWVPWTNGRLAAASGYRAGVRSPGWYEHLWLHRTEVATHWMSRVTRLLRDRDLGGAPAQAVDAVRLAECLASLRGRSLPGLEEMNDATLATLCSGNDVPLRTIVRELVIGERLGAVPEDAPTVPLARDIARLQKSLRLPVTADDRELELDLRKENDRDRSRLLRRLRLLDVPWATEPTSSGGSLGTFKERWRLQWKPEFAVRVIERARFGSTVEEAAGASVRAEAERDASLGDLVRRLNDVLLADLPIASATVVRRIGEVAASGSDVETLLSAIPPLVTVVRYGDVRATQGHHVMPLIATIVARATAGLAPACRQVSDDNAAATANLLRSAHQALVTLADGELLEEWEAELGELADAEDAHGLLVGSANRLLLDRTRIDGSLVGERMQRWLSAGSDAIRGAAWLDGFLADGGAVLVHDAALLALVDGWVAGLSRERFEAVLPLVRRTFARCSSGETRRIGAAVASRDRNPLVGASDGYSHERALRMLPTLALLLGKESSELLRSTFAGSHA